MTTANNSDPRVAAIAAIVTDKARSRREKLDAIAAMGLKTDVAAGELIVTDASDAIVFTTEHSPANFEGDMRPMPKAKAKAKVEEKSPVKHEKHK